MSFAWPDIVIAAILIIAAFRGWRRGLIGELAGAIALFAGLLAPWYYNGSADATIASLAHVGPGSAHVIGMFLTGIAAYAIVMALAWALERIAKLPGLGLLNSSIGALIALAKGIKLHDTIVEDSLNKARVIPHATKTSFLRDVETKGTKNEGNIYGETIMRMSVETGVPAPMTKHLFENLSRQLNRENAYA